MAKIINKKEVNFPYLAEPVKVLEYENGHQVVLVQKESPLINISSWVKTGSINENCKNNGVSHFVEHLLFKGTPKYPAGEFDKKMEENGGIINAATWKDYTFYYINIPKENFKIAFEMHADMICNAIFPAEEIGPEFDINGDAPAEKRERYVVIEEISMGEDNNWRKVYRNLNKNMYENHPYKREVIGTREIISQISREEIVRYYKTFYIPQNITTIIAGEFDENEIIDLIEKNFVFENNSDIEKCKTDEIIPEERIKKAKTIIDYAQINTAYLMMGALCGDGKNLKESLALEMISIILGDGKSSRLYKTLIEEVEQPYFYQIESCHYQLKGGDNFFIEANFEATKKDIAIDEIKKHLVKISENIEPWELEKAKKRIKVNFAHDSETVCDVADSIGFWATTFNDISKAQEYFSLIEEIDSSYLLETAKKYLSKENIATSLLLPKGDENEAL